LGKPNDPRFLVLLQMLLLPSWKCSGRALLLHDALVLDAFLLAIEAAAALLLLHCPKLLPLDRTKLLLLPFAPKLLLLL
jgi:hypothetical protein